MLKNFTNVRNIVSHHDVREREVCSRPVWQMAHDQTVGDSTVLVDHQEVGDVVGAAGLH